MPKTAFFVAISFPSFLQPFFDTKKNAEKENAYFLWESQGCTPEKIGRSIDSL